MSGLDYEGPHRSNMAPKALCTHYTEGVARSENSGVKCTVLSPTNVTMCKKEKPNQVALYQVTWM